MILPGCFTTTRFMVLYVLMFQMFSSVSCAAPDESGQVVAGKNGDRRARVALVIGNSNYRTSPLKNSANDARSMAATLRHLGFEVEEKTDLGYREMNRSVDSFCKKLKSGGVGLFYYAGHGMQLNGNNYLIPVDSQIESENEVNYKAIDAGRVLGRMGRCKNGVNLVILDACRDNPFSRSFRSTGVGLAGMDVPKGAFIAYATAPGNTADDGEGKNGLYTSELVKALETPGIPLEQVFARALAAVREKSGSRQTPCVASNLEGEFYFIPPSGSAESEDSESYPSAAQSLAVVAQSEAHDSCFRLSDIFGSWVSDDMCVIAFSNATSSRPRVSNRM